MRHPKGCHSERSEESQDQFWTDMPVKKPEMFRFAQHDSATFMITKSEPDEHGHWGKFGGRYVPETLVAPLEELTNEFTRARHDDNFWRELNCYCAITLADQRRCFMLSVCPPTLAERKFISNAKIFCTPARTRSITPWARRCWRAGWAKQRVIAETGAGQHGVATATVCALFGLRCVIYMGAEDVRRQALNVFRMRLLGAEVIT